jgi:hypothetical protein
MLKKEKKEKVIVPPNFKSKKEELAWYRKQKMKAQLLQIKHVSIQYKDIQMMLFDEDRRLVNLYMRTDFSKIDDLDKYIQISRFKDGCDIIVSLIINSTWLVNFDEFDNKTLYEIEVECNSIESEINNLKSLSQTDKIKNRIILLEYRLNTIREFALNKFIEINKSLTL